MTLLNSKFKYEITYVSTEPIDETSIKQRLSYPIQKHKEAYYTSKIVDEIPKKKDKNIIRQLITKTTKQEPEKIKTKKPKLKIEELDKKLEEILEEEIIK